MMNNKTVLIVDDEPHAIRVLSAILKEEGYRILESRDVDSAVNVVRTESVDAIITDLKMPAKDGFELFRYVSENNPDIPVVFLTAYGTVDSAVNAMRNGAFYYFIKPPDYARLKDVLFRALEQYSVKKEFENLKKRAYVENNVYPLIGKSPSMSDILRSIASVKDSESSVLIEGETGTGKEVVACNLHYGGKRYNKPFITVNCAAIPKELIESELFGYEKGAFTGATVNKAGKFEMAADGTIFLDEIGELELSVQAKLLRVLQEREVERLGTNRKIKVNFRLLSSTNRDLKKEVENGRFREDLYYRINVIRIDMPPLRDRKQDIPILAAEFLNSFSMRENKPFTLSDEIMDVFLKYDWPGNVRQLKNVIERAVVMAKGGKISLRDLPEDFPASNMKMPEEQQPIKSLRELERQAINEALLVCNGNKSLAAKRLGISRKTFYKWLREM
jgi:DNA-binding NtrC family response regulator